MMADGFDAESGQDHILEFIPVQIYKDGSLVADIETSLMDLKLSAEETKSIILKASNKVPTEMKNNPAQCAILYTDDNIRQDVSTEKNLLRLENFLAGEDAHMEIRMPRLQQYEQPVMDTGAVGIKMKPSN